MVTKELLEQLEQLINPHLNQVLLVAETALPASQFQAYRKVMLNEFGKNGLVKELDKFFNEALSKGTVRNGQEYTEQRRGAS